MTEDANSPIEIAKQSRFNPPGCLVLCVTAFLVLVGLYWLITGEIIIPYKAVYVTGLSARIVAVLWILFSLGLSVSKRSS
jgi:hypothetical protein